MFGASKTARIEREALSELFHATKGGDWLNNQEWGSNAMLQEWHGVKVDADGRVIALHLGGGKTPGIYTAVVMSSGFKYGTGSTTRGVQQ